VKKQQRVEDKTPQGDWEGVPDTWEGYNYECGGDMHLTAHNSDSLVCISVILPCQGDKAPPQDMVDRVIAAAHAFENGAQP
jgi:hypothetical protein